MIIVFNIIINYAFYINNLIFGITIDSKFVNLMDFKKKKGIGSIPLNNFTIQFKIGEDKDEY